MDPVAQRSAKPDDNLDEPANQLLRETKIDALTGMDVLPTQAKYAEYSANKC